MTEISTVKHPGYVQIILDGRIDGQSAPEIEKVFLNLTSNGERILVADFTEVRYISSAGLRIFLSVQKTLRQISGEIILYNLPDIVREVLVISGFISIFKSAGTAEELKNLTGGNSNETGSTEIDINGIKAELKKFNNPHGSVFVFGSGAKLNVSGYEEADVVEVDHSSVDYGTGLAALGESYTEYSGLFGESLIINKNFFNYPAIKNPAVDFIFGNLSEASLKYKVLHGFGFNGKYSSIINIDNEEEPVSLAQIVELAKNISATNLFGIVILMESAGILGMNLKKIPTAVNKPQTGEIFDQNNFAEWMNFPIEPACSGNIIAGSGLAVKDKSKLRDEIRTVFSEGADSHIHAGIFDKGFISKKSDDFESELSRVVKELSAYKIQHLLGKSKFKRGLVAIIDLE